MEYLFIISSLIGAVALLVRAKNSRTSNKSDMIAMARQRAKDRAESRAFADTEPVFDPYRTGIEYCTEMDYTKVVDLYNQHDRELTGNQLSIIKNVFSNHMESPISMFTPPVDKFSKIELNVIDYENAEVVEAIDPWSHMKF